MSSRRKKSSRPLLVLTERARVDLAEIERYSVREWGRKTADRYLDEIQSALDRLKEDPDILRLEPDLAPGLYFYRVRKHFLVCDCTGDMIIILTVIHTSMDIPARLAELQPQLESEVRLLRQRCHGDAGRN